MSMEAGSRVTFSLGEPGPSTPAPADTEPKSPPHKTTAACANCRLRKIKCSGEKPVCNHCAKGDQECFYPRVASRKRRRRVEIERAAAARKSLDARLGDAAFPVPAGSRASISPTTANTYTPSSIWSNAAYSQDLSATVGATIDWSFDNAFGGDLAPLSANPLSNPANTQDSALNALLAFDPAFSNPFISYESLSDPIPSDSGVSDSAGTATNRPSRRTKLRIPYFSGPTAIAPGYKKVTSNVSRAPSPSRLDRGARFGQAVPKLFAPAPHDIYPNIDHLTHLVPIFYSHFGYLFSYLRLPVEPVTLLTLSNYHAPLLNIVCALAARYSPRYGVTVVRGDSPAGNTWEDLSCQWATKAKEQAGMELAISSDEMVQTLLLISWYEFGGDRDGGLWMYSGMAFRMAQDMGFDTLARPQGSIAPQDHSSLRLHATLRIMDAIMTIGTGRAGMFQESTWDIPIVPPLNRSDGGRWLDPLPYLLSMFVFANRVTSILVQHDAASRPQECAKIQGELTEFYNNMPEALRFNATALGAYAMLDHGGGFVLLHVWFHALIILSYCPEMLTSSVGVSLTSAVDTPAQEVAASSAKSILDIISFAELIDAKAVTQPWLNYPLYLAARVFISKCEDPKRPSSSASISAARLHISRAARQDFTKVMSTLGNIEQYWLGLKYIRRALDQKAEGIEQVDLGDEEDVSIPDLMAMLEKAASGRSHEEVLGLSLAGTVNSPNDNHFGIVFPTQL